MAVKLNMDDVFSVVSDQLLSGDVNSEYLLSLNLNNKDLSDVAFNIKDNLDEGKIEFSETKGVEAEENVRYRLSNASLNKVLLDINKNWMSEGDAANFKALFNFKVKDQGSKIVLEDLDLDSKISSTNVELHYINDASYIDIKDVSNYESKRPKNFWGDKKLVIGMMM